MKSRPAVAMLVVLTAAFNAGHSALGQSSEAVRAPLSLTIRSVLPVVRAGSDVIVEVIMKNISDHGIPDFRGSAIRYTPGLALEVLDRNGASARRTELGERLKRGSDIIPTRNIVGGPELGPGQAWENLLYLSGPYDLSNPGEYTIRVGQRLTSSMVVESNSVTLTVLPAPEFDQRFAGSGAQYLLTVTTPEETVKSGAGIPLRIYTTNLTNQNLTFDCAKLSMHVEDPQGTPLSWTGDPDLRRVHDEGDGVPCSVAAHGTLGIDRTYFSKWYDLSKPGKYTIQASRFDDETKTLVKSNTITVTVVP